MVRKQTLSHALIRAQSILSTVVKNATAVKKVGENTTFFMAKTDTKYQEHIAEKMEKLFKLYIDYQSRCCMPLSTALVTTKVLSLYEDLQKKC